MAGLWCVAACLLYTTAKAQQNEPPKQETQADKRAKGTRDFLGLGTPPDAAAAERGQKLFTPNCSFCHGMKATGGDTGPDLVRSTLVLHDVKGDLISTVVHNGRPTKGMPAFSTFTNTELYDLAEFLHMRVELTANRGTYKVLNVLTGNAQAGKAYFEGKGKCNTCHSATGDLAHVGSKLSPADLQQAFLYPSRDAAQTVTVTRPAEKVITGTLKHLDDFQVSLSDESGEYHSIPRTPGTHVEVDDPLAAHRKLLDQYTDADMHNVTAYLATLK